MNGHAVYGGTFDPIHHGHLRSAVEVREALGVELLHLVPSATPPHRATPAATAEQRLAMLKLAIQGEPGLIVDDRELRRSGPSYSIDTLRAMRREIEPDSPLYLVMGSDAFALLHTWHEWRNLTSEAHLVVLERPGYESKLPPQGVLNWAKPQQADLSKLSNKPSGHIVHLGLARLDISASQIRQLVCEGKSANYLMPEPVQKYIQAQGLYQNHQDAEVSGE